MNQQSSHNQATIEPVKNVSRAWLIPLVAAAVGAWIIYYNWSHQGPLITIQLDSATGIEINKTKIKARSLDIGTVKKIELKPDLSGVIVTARLNADTDHLLTENTEFWLVTPRIGLSGISGLSTLLSGSYIAMEPSEEGQAQQSFIALEDPPVTPPGTPGLHITLNSDDEFAYSQGDPIIYKGLKVGDIEDIYFNIEERVVYYNAFIEAPYHKLITKNTRFWDTSGVSLDLSANGVAINAGSLETLLTNGVTFDVPSGMPSGQQITKRAYFDIYPDYETASVSRYKLSADYVLLIDETVRGLQVGAPVEYRGLQIGEVKWVNLQPETDDTLLDEGYEIPVLIGIYPGRIQMPDNQVGLEAVRSRVNHWIGRDLRATLRVGNVITGALYVDLQHFADAEPNPIQSFMDYDVIPTVSDEFTQITQKVTAILDKFNQLPLEGMLEDIDLALTAMSEAAASVEQTSDNFNALIADVNSKELNNNLNATLSQLETLLKDYSAGSMSHTQINRSMAEVQRTLRALQPILLELNKSPNSLIFSGQQEVKYSPQALQHKKNKGTFND